MLSASVIVIVVGQQASDPSMLALQRTLRGVLGPQAHVQVESASSDPPDQESEAKAENADGVVELVWSNQANFARIHCFVRRDTRWVDREIGFGEPKASPEREALERGRLLGFAIATMFVPEAAPTGGNEPAHDSEREAEPPPERDKAPRPEAPKPSPTQAEQPSESRAPAPPPGAAVSARRSGIPRELEFAGVGSVGIEGNAGGLGAMAGARFDVLGPVWSRWFVSGRAGYIGQAQATTRAAFAGTGLVLSSSGLDPWQLGVRLDAFASYLDVSHLSEDDPDPVRRSRFLAGLDLAGELGFRFTTGTALSVAVGIEALSGKTEIYVHQTRVSVVPSLRTTGEVGIKTSF